MNEAQKRRLRTSRFTLSVYWITMFIGTHVPVAGDHPAARYDKVLHFGAFAVLAFFIAFYRRQLGPMTRSAYIAIFAIVAAYGVLDEFTQQFVQGRSGDPLDWLADLAGAATGLAAFRWHDQRRSNVDMV